MGRVLVLYDTKNGSTAEVAEAIGSHLRERQLEVEVARASRRRDFSDIQALIVGAPIYSGLWMRGAHRALRQVLKVPESRRPPVAIFALGPRDNNGPEDWVRPREQFEKVLQTHSPANPVASALFGGADPPGKVPRRDIRDWSAISAWATEVAARFSQEPGGATNRST